MEIAKIKKNTGLTVQFILALTLFCFTAMAEEADIAEIMRAVPPPGAEIGIDGVYGYSGHKAVDELRARMREHRYSMRRKMMPKKPYRTTTQGATWEYRLTEDASSLEGASNPSREELVVPDSFEGKAVSTMNAYLFVPIDPPITKIVLPASLKEIGEKGANPFRNMLHLEEIEFAAENAAYTIKDGAVYTKDMTELIAVPAGKKAIVLSEKLKIIRNGALANSALEGEIVLPKSVEKIGDAAFMGTKNLTKVVIPAEAEVSPSAFSYSAAQIVK